MIATRADTAFARETLGAELWPDLHPLIAANHDESQSTIDTPVLDVDRMRYETLERGGVLRLYTVRDDHGRLIGYSAFIVSPSANYAPLIVAHHVGLYVHPHHRGMVGVQFVRWCDRQLAEEGVGLCRQSAKAGTPFAALLEALGYDAVEVVHQKHIGTERT